MLICLEKTNCEVGPSAKSKSLRTLCHNLRDLAGIVNLYDSDIATHYSWPEGFEPINSEQYNNLTDLQKFYCTLISKRVFRKTEIARKFVSVGVRWLGFLCSLLNACLTSECLVHTLENLPDCDLPSKSKRDIRDNTVDMLKTLRKCSNTIKKIYEFSKIHFLCWRQAVDSDGSTVFTTAVETSRKYAEVGMELEFGHKYFTCINRHLYNADAVFLPLSGNPDHSSEVFKILKEGIENGWQYQPASFKTRLQYEFTKEQHG